MCVRFFIDKSNSRLSTYIEKASMSPLIDRYRMSGSKNILAFGDIGPASVTPVIATSRSGNMNIFPMKWGFSFRRQNEDAEKPGLLVNARTETAWQKPMFAEAWKHHRCVVPASFYYEWTHPVDADGSKIKGEKHSVMPSGQDLTYLCGIYRSEFGLPCFVILTREASDTIKMIHDRMPLIIPEEMIEDWIDPRIDPKRAADRCLEEMIIAGGVK